MKLAPRQYGPFTVVTKISDVAYQLKLPNAWKIHNVFHVSLLTPYKETDKHRPNFLEPPPDLIDGEEEWEIEKILGHQTYRKKKQYLIRWKGYAPTHDSWTDESGLHAPELIADYKQQLVRQILINLIQSMAEVPQDQSSMAEIPHDQSSTAEIPYDQSSAAEIPHNQSSMAEIPHDQSALSKRWETIRIRTVRTEDEEAFPTPPQTGSFQRTHILPEPIPSSFIYEPQVLQLPAQSSNAHNSHAQSSAQLLLPRMILSVPRQKLDVQSGISLSPLHSLSPPSDTLPHWTSGHRINEEIQRHQHLSQTYMNNKSPSRDDSASPALTYPEQ